MPENVRLAPTQQPEHEDLDRILRERYDRIREEVRQLESSREIDRRLLEVRISV